MTVRSGFFTKDCWREANFLVKLLQTAHHHLFDDVGGLAGFRGLGRIDGLSLATIRRPLPPGSLPGDCRRRLHGQVFAAARASGAVPPPLSSIITPILPPPR